MKKLTKVANFFIQGLYINVVTKGKVKMRVKPLLNFNLSTLKNNINTSKTNPIKLSKLDCDTVSFTSKKPLVPMTPHETAEVFKSIGVRAKVKPDQTVSVWRYISAKANLKKLEKMGIDEDSLFQHVSQIEGTMILDKSNLKSLQNIREVGYDLVAGPNLEDLGELRSVGHNLLIEGPKIKDLGNLIGVGNNFYMLNTTIRDPKNLKYIGGSFIRDNRDYYEAFQKISAGCDVVICVE